MKLSREKLALLGLCPTCKARVLSALEDWEEERRNKITESVIRRISEGKKGGRPMGSKDKKKRRRAGYYMRYEKDPKKGMVQITDEVELHNARISGGNNG